MQFSTLTVAALALTLGVSAAPAASDMKNGLRARQSNELGVRVNVGLGDASGSQQTIGVFIADGGDDTGSEGFGFELDGATLLTAFVEDSGVFTNATCQFTSGRLANDANGNVQCDLTTIVGQGSASAVGTVISFTEQANCMFCTLFEIDS